jgi:hypothetical protein
MISRFLVWLGRHVEIRRHNFPKRANKMSDPDANSTATSKTDNTSEPEYVTEAIRAAIAKLKLAGDAADTDKTINLINCLSAVWIRGSSHRSRMPRNKMSTLTKVSTLTAIPQSCFASSRSAYPGFGIGSRMGCFGFGKDR